MAVKIYSVHVLPLAQRSVDRITETYVNTPELVRAVRIFLGRRPKEAAPVNSRKFGQPLCDRLPSQIRVLQTPDPSSMPGTTSLIFYYKESDETAVVSIYYIDAV
jgi:hypothetical protein